jgi:hypothetical protein
MVEELRDATGHTAEVTRLDDRRWRLTLASDRVHMTYDFKISGSGARTRCIPAGRSTLTVDGQRQPLAESFDHFVRIFRNPDSAGARLEPPPMSVPIEPAPEGKIPTEIRSYHRIVTERLGGQLSETLGEIEVQVGTVGPDHWAIGVQFPRGTLRMNFRACHRDGHGNHVEIDRSRPIQLLLDGRDLTEALDGSLDRAFALMSRPAGEPTPGGPAIAGPASAARSNSVEVRRATVIRT